MTPIKNILVGKVRLCSVGVLLRKELYWYIWKTPVHFRGLYGSGFRIDESIYLANCAV